MPDETTIELAGRQVSVNEEWVNYWDANPEDHGGRWVRWDDHMWQIVEVSPPELFPDDLAKGQHLVDVIYVEPMDLVHDGETTREFESILESLDISLGAALGPDRDIEYFVSDFVHYRHGRNDWIDEDDDYWDYLEGRFGITEENV